MHLTRISDMMLGMILGAIAEYLVGKTRTARYSLIRGPLTYNQDGLATFHNADFMRDDRFSRAYQKGKDTGSWGVSEIHWRAYMACWAADRGLEGDFVECGVNKGGLARTVLEYVDPKRTMYLLDTFEGLDAKYISEQETREGILPGGYEPCYEAVLRTFSEYPNVKVIRGSVPETLNQVPSEKVAYLSIDMNCAEPEVSACELFWPKLVSGAVILLDDYGWPGHIVQKKALDEFARSKGVAVLPLPTGQGMIFKP